MPGRVIRAAVAYFAVVFAAGFAFGVVRVGWVVPAIGERAAELAEMPLILAVVVLAARWVARKFHLPGSVPVRLAVGALALVLLLSLELTVVLALRGMSFAQYLDSRDPISGGAYLASLLLFGLMPALLTRSAGPPGGDAGGR
jgi:hypothetical protein